MGLYVRDKVRALAAELASRRGCTLTDAARTALEDNHRMAHEREENMRRTREIIASMKELPDLRPGFSDKDLYDDDGNPIL